MTEIEQLRLQLAESQARELRMRDICARAHDRLLRGDDDGELLLMLARGWEDPADDTALREMIEAARREGREHITKLIEGYPHWLGDNAKREIVAAIRAKGQP